MIYGSVNCPDRDTRWSRLSVTMPALYQFRTLDGEMGILPRHENMIAVLAVDEVKVKRIDDENHVNWIAVNGGVIRSCQ